MANEIPDWFTASNYDEAKNFSYKDWFNQLYARYMVIESLNQNTDQNNTWIADFFNSLKNKTYPKMPEMPLIFGHILQAPINLELVKNIDLIQNNLWSSTTSEVTLNFAKLTHNKESLSTVHPPKSEHEPEYPAGVMKPLINKGKIRLLDELDTFDSMGRASLTVDLNGKDIEIRKDFESWLLAAKKIHETNLHAQHVSDDKRKKWVKTRIIAYFDLKIWARLENKVVLNETMMDWIDEDADYINTIVSETYRRKIYAKLEKQLMNSTFFIRLFKYAYGENKQDGLMQILREYISKHNIKTSDLSDNTSQMAEALKNWKPKKP